MKAKSIVFYAVICLSLLLFAGVSYAASDNTQVKIAAENGLLGFKSLLAQNEGYKQFNINNIDELQTATLGEPYENWTLSINKPLDKNNKLINQAEQVGVYIFPVIINGNVITDMTVILDSSDGQWKAVDLGGKASKEIVDIKEKYISRPKIINFSYTNVRVAAFQEQNDELLVPINGVSELSGMPTKTGYKFENVADKLEKIRKNNLSQIEEAKKKKVQLLGGDSGNIIPMNEITRASVITRVGLFMDSL